MSNSTSNSSSLKMKKMMFATIVLWMIVSTSQTTKAGLTLNSSSGTDSYAIYSTTTPGTGAAFSNNMLVNPGGTGFPSLTGPLGDSPSQSNSATTLSPYFLTSATTNSNAPGGYVPSSFGTSTTETYTATSGQQGTLTTQGGVFWSLRTNLADNLSSPNLASVSFSMATASFTNNSGSSITITPGAILSISGSLGTNTSSSFIAAGLTSSITLSGGGLSSPQTTNLDNIILAANGAGSIVASKGSGANEVANVGIVGNSVSGTGTSLDPNSVTLVNGESISITAYLTLISDPGSSINVSDGLPPGFPLGLAVHPDLRRLRGCRHGGPGAFDGLAPWFGPRPWRASESSGHVVESRRWASDRTSDAAAGKDWNRDPGVRG